MLCKDFLTDVYASVFLIYKSEFFHNKDKNKQILNSVLKDNTSVDVESFGE